MIGTAASGPFCTGQAGWFAVARACWGTWLCCRYAPNGAWPALCPRFWVFRAGIPFIDDVAGTAGCPFGTRLLPSLLCLIKFAIGTILPPAVTRWWLGDVCLCRNWANPTSVGVPVEMALTVGLNRPRNFASGVNFFVGVEDSTGLTVRGRQNSLMIGFFPWPERRSLPTSIVSRDQGSPGWLQCMIPIAWHEPRLGGGWPHDACSSRQCLQEHHLHDLVHGFRGKKGV